MKNRIEMQKNQLLQHGNQIVRVLDIEADRVFIIDCIKKTMPVWIDAEALNEYIPCSEDTFYTGIFLGENTSVSIGENKFSLGSITESGSYRLLITVTKNNKTLEIPYYFIVE